ncbi:MAG: YfcC family protein [Aquaticitalea sp.]
MKKIKFPSAQTVLILICALVAILTWLIPAGKYNSLTYDSAVNTFIITESSVTRTIAGTQQSLDELQITIPIEKFTSGSIVKPISIPNTFKKVDAKPQGFSAFIQSPIKGVIDAADIIFLVLIIGGLIGIMNITGAFDAGVSWLATALKGKEFILIILVTTLIALGGTTFGLAEETIAFYPILIPVFLAAKYDAMVALASIYIGSSIGTMMSTTNPFCTIIASDSAGINWTDGLNGRLMMFVAGLAICIIYILRYAKRVRNDATKSVIYDQKEEIEHLFNHATDKDKVMLTGRLRIILLVFMMTFVIMIYGVSQLGWWFVEMTSVFLAGAILIGFIAKINEMKFVEAFVKGANDLLGVAFIIGIARGVTILMNDGMISDTILYYASNATEGMNEGIFINSMFYIYSGLSFFIPSSSGMAVLTMPIMSPLADTVGIGRELIVNAYQFGCGLFNFVNPTGLILASLAIVKVGFDKWLKFVMPLVIILALFSMLVLTLSVYL